ncbi:MAG: type II toxin-antitoxin system VapC family toxin [Polyangiaceae bacterium]
MIVLDTGAWVLWVSAPSSLSAKAAKAIADEEKKQGIVVSAISLWEVAQKVAAGKLALDRDLRAWVKLAASYPGLSVVPVTPEDAIESTLLPGTLHEDPADRMIVALARRLDAPLITSDAAIRAYRHVKTIW